jgi:hypothetical protein
MKLSNCLVLLAALFCFKVNAATIMYTDIATSCELSGNVVFRCGVGSISPVLADNFEGGLYEEKSSIEFSLKGMSSVNSAILRFKLIENTNSYVGIYETPIIEIHGYSGSGTISYNHLNTHNLLLTSTTLETLGWYEFDVTEFVSSLVNNNQEFAGFAIRDIVPNSQANFYTSSEVTTMLVVSPEPVPLPTAAFLFSSAICALFTVIRMRA